MAAITKADIIIDVNENLKFELAADSTGLDRAILKTLTDMSNKDLLVGTDATQTLVADDTTLAYPTGYREQIAITLTNAAGIQLAPLLKLPRGHEQYRQLRDNDDSNGTPTWFSEFNKLFFLWRSADQAYTTLIEYYKDHPKDVGNIEFETEFENVMFAGTIFWKATALNRTRAIALWGPLYQRELDAAAANRNLQPIIVSDL